MGVGTQISVTSVVDKSTSESIDVEKIKQDFNFKSPSDFMSQSLTVSRMASSDEINWKYPDIYYDRINDDGYITGFFKSWNMWTINPISLEDSIHRAMRNIDMITGQARLSFAALEWNETQLGAEINKIKNGLNNNGYNTRFLAIEDRLNPLERFTSAQNVWNDALERRMKAEEVATATFNENFTDIRDRRKQLYSANLNDVIKTGDYYAYNVYNSPTGISNIGFLSVTGNDNGTVLQEFTAYNDPKKVKYARVKNGQSWSAWTSESADLQKQLDEEKARWQSIGDTDLNTFYNAGRYYSYRTKNMPTGVSTTGYLFVTSSAGWAMQEYTPDNEPQTTYSRIRTNGNWSAWKSATKDLQSQIDDEKGRWATLNNKDLNTAMTAGMYLSRNSTNQPAGVYPDGYLSVMGTAGYIYQSYTPTVGSKETYTRFYYSGNWSAWQSVTGDLQKQIDDEKGRWATLNSKDLNKATTAGMYLSRNSTNQPTGASVDGYLSVMGSGNYIYQSYTPYNSPQTTYTRYYYSGNWSSWKSVTGDLQKAIDDEKGRWATIVGKDLNKEMTTGMYFSRNSINQPKDENADGYLTVILGAGNHTYQSYTPAYNAQSTYTRYYYSGHWSEWTKTSISATEFETVKNRVNDLVDKVATNIDDIRDLKNGVSSLNAWKNVQLAWNALQEVEIAGVKKDIGGLKDKDIDLQRQLDKFEGRFKKLHNPNLNNIKTSGSYYVSNATNSPFPNGGWGFLTVVDGEDGARVVQEYVPDHTSTQKFRRVYYPDNGGWSAWLNVSVSKNDIDSLKTKDIDLQNKINAEQLARENTDKGLDRKIDYVDSRFGRLESPNLNNTTRAGMYYVNKATNGPSGNTATYAFLTVINDGFDRVVYQEFVYDHQPYRKFTRNYRYQEWSAWTEVTISKSEIDALKQKDSDQQQQINANITDISALKTFNIAQTAWNVKQELDNQSQDDRITALENFDWMEVIDLVAVVHAIDVVRDRVAETRDLFKQGGEFYALMSMQHADTVQKFDLLNTTIKLQFSSYFGTNGIFWLSAKTFSDTYIVNFMQALTVTLNQQWQRNWADITSIWGITNQALSVNNNRLEQIYFKLSEIAGRPPIQTKPFEFDYDKLQEMFDGLEIKTSDLDLKNVEDWLKKIFDKKGFEFDYDKLQTMLNKLEFGNVVNEAGTNVWDFLSELVDTLGKGLEDILDFLESMTDKLIALVVPDNLDFIDQKFDSTASTIKLKFSFVFGWIDTFKNLFGNQVQFEDVELNLGSMFDGKSTSATLPLSVINDFAPIAKMVITGFVLLEFLIDMYKWFHTRGEVIE